MSASPGVSARGVAVLVAVIVAAIVVWMRAAMDVQPEAPVSQHATDPVARTASHRPARTPRIGDPATMRHTAAVPTEIRGHHMIDPCATPFEADVPDGYDSITEDGITVAWIPTAAPNPGPYDAPLRPTSVAHLVAGAIAEAAQLTGTVPRSQLTVVIYPSTEDFLASTGAPRWAGGLYDGGAVRLPLTPNTDLGISFATLRHEVMHAQVHSGVGCAPVWLNEGLAMYFAGEPPTKEWIHMLRTPEPFLVVALEAPNVEDSTTERADRIYAQSLAMISYLTDHGGDAELRRAVQTLRAGGLPRGGLWTAMYPSADLQAVLGALAQRVFGLSLGDELRGVLDGGVCCYGLRSLTELGCRRAPPGAPRFRLDHSASPRAACDPSW